MTLNETLLRIAAIRDAERVGDAVGTEVALRLECRWREPADHRWLAWLDDGPGRPGRSGTGPDPEAAAGALFALVEHEAKGHADAARRRLKRLGSALSGLPPEEEQWVVQLGVRGEREPYYLVRSAAGDEAVPDRERATRFSRRELAQEAGRESVRSRDPGVAKVCGFSVARA